MQADPVLPFWFVGPLALVVMVLIAGHLLAMRSAKDRIPASRYRIRSVNGSMMLAVVPLLACAFSVVSPDDQKFFTLLWMGCVGLLGIVVLLAVIDGLNNLRIGHREASRLIAEHRALLAKAAANDMDRRRRVASARSESDASERDG